MDNSSFKTASALHLGSPLYHPHHYICCTKVDSSRVHGLSCNKSAGRFSTHSHVNNLIKRALESTQVPTILEQQSVSCSNGKRPDGREFFLREWESVWCGTLHAATRFPLVTLMPHPIFLEKWQNGQSWQN